MMFRSLMLLLIVAPLVLLAAGCESGGEKEEKAAAAALPKQQAISPEARRGDAVYAYVDGVRAELSNGKARLINQVMRLSSEEAIKFWPIYHDYEDELFSLGDRRVEMTRQFVTAQAAQSLDDQRASALTEQWFDFESRRLELLRKYHEQIAKELSPTRAAQFAQIEHRVGTVVDLLIASELPLVRADRPQPRE